MPAALTARLGLMCMVAALLLGLAPGAPAADLQFKPIRRGADRASPARLSLGARLRLEQSLVSWRQDARQPPQQRSIPKRIFITVPSKARLSRLAQVGDWHGCFGARALAQSYTLGSAAGLFVYL